MRTRAVGAQREARETPPLGALLVWFMRVVVVPAAAAEAVFIIVATYGTGHLLCLYKHLQLLLLLLLIYLYRFFSASDSKLDLCYSCPPHPLATFCVSHTLRHNKTKRKKKKGNNSLICATIVI